MKVSPKIDHFDSSSEFPLFVTQNPVVSRILSMPVEVPVKTRMYLPLVLGIDGRLFLYDKSSTSIKGA